jgi:NitT/TauT family transport system substrate-binding protein
MRMNAMAVRPILAWISRVLALVLFISLLSACDRGGDPAAEARPPSDSFILATTPYAGAAPAFVAVAKGYLEGEGLKVTVQTYPSGKAALDAVIAGKADVATVAELPVALAVTKGNPVAIFATLSEQTDYGVVGRADRGVSVPASLKGKRIAVSAGTSADFLLDALLIRQRLARADVQVIDRKPDEMAAALERGEADAISTWEPYVSDARKRLGANAIVFTSTGIYESTFNLAAMRQFVNTRGETVKKILRAMVRAEQLMASDPAGSEKIVASAMKKSPDEARELLTKNRFALSIEQNLLVVMEDESRWAVKNKVVEAKGTPNFLDAVYVDGLAAVSPRSVTVIR